MKKQKIRRILIAAIAGVAVGTLFAHAQQFKAPEPSWKAPNDGTLNQVKSVPDYLLLTPTPADSAQTMQGGLITGNGATAASFLGHGTTNAGIVGAAGSAAFPGSFSATAAGAIGYSSTGPVSIGLYANASGANSVALLGRAENAAGFAGRFTGTSLALNGAGGQLDTSFDSDGMIDYAAGVRYTGLTGTTTEPTIKDYLFSVGYTDTSGGISSWVIQKIHNTTGAVTTVTEAFSFDDNQATDVELAIENGTAYVYVVGWYEKAAGTRTLRVEKRSAVTLALIDFDDSVCNATGANAATVDGAYIYIGGFSNNNGVCAVGTSPYNFHLEKRQLSNLDLVPAFDGDGIKDWNFYGVLGNQINDLIFKDLWGTPALYVVGYKNDAFTPKAWDVEKVNNLDGSLITSPTFSYKCPDDNGNGDNSDDCNSATARRILFDRQGLFYVLGSKTSVTPNLWRISKHSSDGYLCWWPSNGTCPTAPDDDGDGQFGFGTVTSKGYLDMRGGSQAATTVNSFGAAIRDGALYIAGQESTGTYFLNLNWRIEKRDYLTGKLLPSWGNNGSLTNYARGYPTALYVADRSVYAAGSANVGTPSGNTDARIEKRMIEKFANMTVQNIIYTPYISATSRFYDIPAVTASDGIRFEADTNKGIHTVMGYGPSAAAGMYGRSVNAVGFLASSTLTVAGGPTYGVDAFSHWDTEAAYAYSTFTNAAEGIVGASSVYPTVAATSTPSSAPTVADANAGVNTGIYAKGGAYAGYFDGLIEIENGYLKINNTQLNQTKLQQLLTWCGSLCL